MKQRLAPFLALLDARYAPLLFAVAPQSFAVYLWLWRGSDRGDAAFWFAVIGAIGYEFIYVGAIAWAEEGQSTRWTWATAFVALVFSVAVAVYVYIDQGWWAALHAGFPVVAFCYTIAMHIGARQGVQKHQEYILLRATVAQRDEELAHERAALVDVRAALAQYEHEVARLTDVACTPDTATVQELHDLRAANDEQLHDLAQYERELAQARADLAQRERELHEAQHTPVQVGDLDLSVIARELRTPRTEPLSWRMLEDMLHTPQSTLRARMKVNGAKE